MTDAGAIVGIVIGVLVALFIIRTIFKGIIIIRERQAVVVERFGAFGDLLQPGIHCIIPGVDRPKSFTHRYHTADMHDNVNLVERKNETRVSTQAEVLDFPKQMVITRDNALIELDAVLNYKVVSPRKMLYSTINLPHMMAKLLQAQLRNVAGSVDVDQLIEGSAAVGRISGEMAAVASRWGVEITFVRLQRVQTGSLQQVLEQKKNADLKNQSLLIQAKSKKQQLMLGGEGRRDQIIREAEGEAAQIRSHARGEARAVVNRARAEAVSVTEIGRALGRRRGIHLMRYMLALKYVQALQEVLAMPNTEIGLLPRQTAPLQSLQLLGLSTVHPPRKL